MLLREALAIAPRETTGTLHDRLATLGGVLIVRALQELQQGELQATPQPSEGISYAHKISKAESALDWSLPAQVLERRVRAFNPFPGTHTVHGGVTIKLWECEIDSDYPNTDKRCGHIVYMNSSGIGVACGDASVLRLTTLQRAGGKRLAAGEFLRGHPMSVGDRLGAMPE